MQGLGASPVTFFLGPPDRQDQIPIPILGSDDVNQQFVARLEGLQAWPPQSLKLLGRHNAFRLGANVNQHLCGGHADDLAFHDVPLLEPSKTQRLLHQGVHWMVINGLPQAFSIHDR